ncbi:hypothetical protein Tco_0650491 [Tanacetum coccineum]
MNQSSLRYLHARGPIRGRAALQAHLSIDYVAWALRSQRCWRMPHPMPQSPDYVPEMILRVIRRRMTIEDPGGGSFDYTLLIEEMTELMDGIEEDVDDD